MLNYDFEWVAHRGLLSGVGAAGPSPLPVPAGGVLGARAEHPSRRRLITNLPIWAQPTMQKAQKKTWRWGRQLPRNPRAVTLQSSAWARAHHVALDPLPYACGLASFGAVRLVPPRHADINKVTRTNTVYIPRCHQLSPTPNMIAMSPLACPCPDIPVLVFLLGWATLALRCNQNEAQEVVLQLVGNEMSWWLEGLGGTSGLPSSYSSQVFY